MITPQRDRSREAGQTAAPAQARVRTPAILTQMATAWPVPGAAPDSYGALITGAAVRAPVAVMVVGPVVVSAHAAEVARAEGSGASGFLVVVTVGVVPAVVMRGPSAAARKDVLDALVGRWLPWQTRPRRRQSAPVQVLELGGVPRVFGDVWDCWKKYQYANTKPQRKVCKSYVLRHPQPAAARWPQSRRCRQRPWLSLGEGRQSCGPHRPGPSRCSLSACC